MPGFERHIAACNNVPGPQGLVPFRIGDQQVGWLGPELARALTFFPRDIHFDGGGAALAGRLRLPAQRSQALEGVVKALADRGHFKLRNEAFDVRAGAEGPVLATIDRGALAPFGIMSQGVHVNGLVRRAEGLHVWVGFRARDKAMAPGKLDNVVAGGIPAGMSPFDTLLKEAEEEACIPAELARAARPVGRVSYVMANEEGLRRDVLHCYDLDLPEGFVPRPGDDEVERFELWPVTRLAEEVRDRDEVKFNVNLVLIDLFLREAVIDPASEEGRRLRAGLDQAA